MGSRRVTVEVCRTHGKMKIIKDDNADCANLEADYLEKLVESMSGGFEIEIEIVNVVECLGVASTRPPLFI